MHEAGVRQVRRTPAFASGSRYLGASVGTSLFGRIKNP